MNTAPKYSYDTCHMNIYYKYSYDTINIHMTLVRYSVDTIHNYMYEHCA